MKSRSFQKVVAQISNGVETLNRAKSETRIKLFSGVIHFGNLRVRLMSKHVLDTTH